MKAIVAVDKNWGIGAKNDLLFHIPEDMKFFRENTKNKIVVMGRKTLLSFPNSEPLKNRTNIVLTHDFSFSPVGAKVCFSVPELLEYLEGYDYNDIYVIGGGEIYSALLPYCDTLIITKVDAAKDADVFFPNVDIMPEWKISEQSDIYDYNGISYRFCTYTKI